jgi:hypothetical protein
VGGLFFEVVPAALAGASFFDRVDFEGGEAGDKFGLAERGMMSS